MRDHHTWRANWHTSEFKRFAEWEARKRTHVLAMTFGTLTGALIASVLIHFAG